MGSKLQAPKGNREGEGAAVPGWQQQAPARGCWTLCTGGPWAPTRCGSQAAFGPWAPGLKYELPPLPPASSSCAFWNVLNKRNPHLSLSGLSDT